MSDKQGRNELCSCGSGKKYKKCCLSTSFAYSEPADFEWRKLRQLEGSVIDDHLIPYVMDTLPEDVMRLAIYEWSLEDLPEEIDIEMFLHQFLMPWILFNWIPYEDFDLEVSFDPELTIAENYMHHRKSKLASDELRFIKAMINTFYSFYAVLEVEKDKSLLVKDMLLGTEHLIKERQGTHCLKRGDIAFSRILTLDNQSIFVGMSPFTMPPQHHTELLGFKKWLIEENKDKPLDGTVLRNELSSALYYYYFEAIISAFDKPLPTFVNTDGDLLELTTSYFTLTQLPDDALNRLISMALSDDPGEFLQEAKRTKAGKITEIHFPWLKKETKNTSSGRIRFWVMFSSRKVN